MMFPVKIERHVARAGYVYYTVTSENSGMRLTQERGWQRCRDCEEEQHTSLAIATERLLREEENGQL
jgi:hypothetical protein